MAKWGRLGSSHSRWHCLHLQARVQPWPSFCWSKMLPLSPLPETCPFRPITWHLTTSNICHLLKTKKTNSKLQPISYNSRLGLTNKYYRLILMLHSAPGKVVSLSTAVLSELRHLSRILLTFGSRNSVIPRETAFGWHVSLRLSLLR